VLRKLLFHPAAGACYVVLSSLLIVRLTGPPETPLALLATLSLAAIAAVAAFLFVAAPARFAGAAGTGVLAMLIAGLGAAIIAVTLAASAFGMGPSFPYAGLAIVVALSTFAMVSVRKDG